MNIFILNGCIETIKISLIVDLWCEVVLQDTKAVNFEFSDEWLLLVEAQSREGRKRSCLVEKIKVVECELLRDGLLNLNKGLILLSIRVVCCQFDEARASGAHHGQLHVVGVCNYGE